MPTDEQAQRRTREAVLGGSHPSDAPRDTIAASWRRVSSVGLDPGSGAEIPPLAEAEVARRRRASGLSDVIPSLTHSLRSVIDAGQLVVVADADGWVLWREGGHAVRRLADDLGFVGGSAWTEGNVGTNAIGTALVLGEGVRVQGPEHFVESHTRWGCAAAPLTDPWSGRILGVLDVSGPSRGMHPAELALVETVARLTSMEIVARRRAELDVLRAHAAPLLARLTGDALAVDPFGHVAAAIGTRAPERVALPDDLTGGSVWLPTLGLAAVEPLAGGWLLRLDSGAATAVTSVVLDLRAEPTLRVDGPSGGWARRLSRRHAEILLALAGAGPDGRSAADLADDLFADRTRVTTVRAELSRLRRLAGSVLQSNPYRFAPGVAVTAALPDDRALVLPGSSAPVVRRQRIS
jgi:hypothetical protein